MIGALFLAAALVAAGPAEPAAKPTATMANDEGGPVRVTGRMSCSTRAVEIHFKPVVALLDFSDVVLGHHREWAPGQGFPVAAGSDGRWSCELAGDDRLILPDPASGALALELQPAP